MAVASRPPPATFGAPATSGDLRITHLPIMRLRDLIRRHRLYQKSGADFTAGLKHPGLARRLPFLAWLTPGATRHIEFASGRATELPLANWDLLPLLCRLDRLGATTRIVDGRKEVRIGDVTMVSPLATRAESEYYREVFLDDIYGTRALDRRGQVVVDIGAWVGDSAVAYARAGASVHAVEPLASLADCIARNAAANDVGGLVTVHPVGLAERTVSEALGDDRLELVEGVAYTLAHLPARIDVLKIDCEGAEYYLFGNEAFLDHLDPTEIRMEYHRGPAPLAGLLAARGYQVEYDPACQGVGLLRAVRP